MQVVANCILHVGDQILLLQKPSRGWWVAPGGKLEMGETPFGTVLREYEEETGLSLLHPELRGVFTINVEEEGILQRSWMLMTFYATAYEGRLLTHSEEGILCWQKRDVIAKLPMAEGDRFFFEHILTSKTLLTGKFTYTPTYELMDWKPDSTTFTESIL